MGGWTAQVVCVEAEAHCFRRLWRQGVAALAAARRLLLPSQRQPVLHQALPPPPCPAPATPGGDCPEGGCPLTSLTNTRVVAPSLLTSLGRRRRALHGGKGRRQQGGQGSNPQLQELIRPPGR